MFKVKARFALLALLLPFLLHATYILKNDLLKPYTSNLIEKMGNELFEKTGISEYVVASNENFVEKFNLVEYSKKYEVNMSKPYVMLIFAPNAVITNKSGQKGRVALIPSTPDIGKLYNKNSVMDATIDVVAVNDKNSKEDKFNIGIVQGFSELADQIADAKNVKLTTTIPNDTRTIIGYLKILVYIGSLFVLWIFIIRPLIMRIKNGKK